MTISTWFKGLSSAFVLSIYTLGTYAQPGSLDLSFDPGTGASSTVIATLVQPDGKVLVGGDFTMFDGQSVSKLVRLNSDGSIDNTFIQQGTGFNSAVYEIKLEAGGTIIVAGSFTSYNGTSRSRVARLNSDGSLNGSFIPGTINNTVSEIAIQSDGKILIGGSFNNVAGNPIGRIARLNSDGSLDAAFSTGAGFNNTLSSLEIQSNGRILVGGAFTSYNGVTKNRIARLMPDGSLDSGFNTGTGANDVVSAIVIQSDDKIVLAGNFTAVNGLSINGVCRLMEDGTVDTGFNNGGSGFISVIPVPMDMALQPDGKILIAGSFEFFNGVYRPYLVRLETDGTLDLSFGSAYQFGLWVLSIAIQLDGKAICGGFFSSYGGVSRNRIARLNGDCTSSTWYADADNDGFGDPNTATLACTQPLGSVANADDCDDNDPFVNLGPIWYPDADGDGYGATFGEVFACVQPAGFTSDNTDCDDNDPLHHEILMWYADSDGDGFGDPNTMQLFCTPLFGYVLDNNDCDDFDPLVTTGRVWFIDADGDGIGSAVGSTVACTMPPGYAPDPTDCDDNDPLILGAITYYVDQDGDGSGDPNNSILSCSPVAGYVTNSSDCNDNDPLDITGPTWYADADFDGFGDPNVTLNACTQPAEYVANSDDCDDNDPFVNLGPIWYPDVDGDGYGASFGDIFACVQPAGFTADNTDCDDNDPFHHEILMYYTDADGDGFGDPNTMQFYCTPPPDAVLDNTDCDDTSEFIYVGAACDDLDPSTSDDTINGTCTCVGTPSSNILLSPIIWLQGPDRGTTLMNGDLFIANIIPLQEPYSALGYPFVGGGGETVTLISLDPNPGIDEDMAVDWVVLELRNIAGTAVIESRAGILRRNGAVHQPNSLAPLEFNSPPGSYRIAIRHRNHLAAITELPVALNTTTTVVDMTNGSVALHGLEPMKTVAGKTMLWAGDVNGDGHLIYTGTDGDRDLILDLIGGVVPTNTVSGYYNEDVNLDGIVRYTLTSNDRDIILENVGGIVPTNQRHQQLP